MLCDIDIFGVLLLAFYDLLATRSIERRGVKM
jgi:hypothetical protein